VWRYRPAEEDTVTAAAAPLATRSQFSYGALVRAGLTPYQALHTGTRNVAQFLGLLDSSGTVAVGKWADPVLLNGNPLQDIQHAREPAGVMINGRWLDRTELDQRRRTP
jgi:imidazolonepropionase-like amidohydrolase